MCAGRSVSKEECLVNFSIFLPKLGPWGAVGGVPRGSFAQLTSLSVLENFSLFLLIFFRPIFITLMQRLGLPFLSRILCRLSRRI